MKVARLAGLGVLAVALLGAGAAHADVEGCVEMADKGQELRDSGQLVEAKEKLVGCSSATCPAAVAKQCARWLQDVEQSMPTIVVRVRDAAGKDVADAMISIDGALRAPHSDGRPIAVNPGPHTLVVRREGSADAEDKIVVAAGEKNRVVTIESKPAVATPITPAPGTPPEPKPSGGAFKFPWYAGVLLGVGVASFIGVAVLVPVARGDANDLRATCAPRCAQDDIDAVQTKITVANVLLGVGIGGVVLGATSLVLANVLGKSERGVTAYVMPLSGGAAFGAAARF